jgi:hypothetical protein
MRGLMSGCKFLAIAIGATLIGCSILRNKQISTELRAPIRNGLRES